MKSLWQLAREPGVSASYLSQVNHGKKQASPKIAKMLTNVNKIKREISGCRARALTWANGLNGL